MSKTTFLPALLKHLPRRVATQMAKVHPRIARNLPPGIVTTANYCGYRMELDTSYPIEREMVSGRYDPHTSRVLSAIVSPGDVVIDIGANVGAISLLCSSLVGASGLVISIEPGPLTHDRLQKVIMDNQIRNIELIQCGLSDTSGKLMWKLDRENLGNASLVEQNGDHVVEVTTLDHLIESRALQKVSLLKIDVEGMELEVLRGGKRILGEFSPTVIFETLVEWRAIKGMEYFLEIERLLQENDYQLFTYDRRTIRRTRISNTGANTLAVHTSKIGSLSRFLSN